MAKSRRPWVLCILLIGAIFPAIFPAISPLIRQAASQTAASVQSPVTYSLRVSVDEVSLTFHAADSQGFPVNDLKIDDLSLLDNGRPPRRILAFQSLQGAPIRAGILMDTSQSMEKRLPADRAISIKYAQRLLRQPTDQAFVMDFGYISKITQPWTGNSVALADGLRNVIVGRENPLGGTALFDTLFRSCLYEFGNIDHAASRNFILLFSDGEDNASHTSLEDVVDRCQRTNTAIYAFRPGSESSQSSGPKTLADLASETGGRVFSDDSEADISNGLNTIEADLNDQYRLVYNPAVVKHDGSFHHIDLKAPERVASITVRSGYYDRAH
jgi:VWFA-related protein